MKKLIFSIAVLAFSAVGAFAQPQHDHSKHAGTPHSAAPRGNAPRINAQSGGSQLAPTPAANGEIAPGSTLTPENIVFTNDKFDFGTVSEGPAADHVFTFKNTGKESLIIQRVQPSCGCTTPDWTKEPIAPGATGMIKASFSTQGRPGRFDKTMTVFSNAGTRTIAFGGTVEKAPETSVPQNGSMMRN